MPLLLSDPERVRSALHEARGRFFAAGHAVGVLKAAAAPVPAMSLAGRLYLSSSGWLLLNVPNDFVRGLFSALHEPGVELPLRDGKLEAHISVMTADEVAKIGPENISERGRNYKYQLGALKCVEPAGQPDMSRCWFVEVNAPELKELRRSYGLTPLPYGDHEFHVTVAMRKKGVLRGNEISKAANQRPDHDARPRHTGHDSEAELDINDWLRRRTAATKLGGLGPALSSTSGVAASPPAPLVAGVRSQAAAPPRMDYPAGMPTGAPLVSRVDRPPPLAANPRVGKTLGKPPGMLASAPPRPGSPGVDYFGTGTYRAPKPTSSGPGTGSLAATGQ